MAALAPVFYLPHGGGPLPLLDDPAHAGLIRFLRTLPASYPAPEAYVVVSAHWESAVPAVYGGEEHPMLFDYYGFPPQSYEYRYPAAGDPALAATVTACLQAQGLRCLTETSRGFDHGTFVPMLLLNPAADIPCVQLSLLKGLNAEAHIALGKALQLLRHRNVVVIGSGMSFHNLEAVWAGPQPRLREASDRFHSWLLHTLGSADLTPEQRLQRLANWEQAPFARFAHPRAEHLLPLHVCAGMAGGAPATLLFDEELLHHKVAGFGWR
ncbi:MAG: DODA-type extradiol aromatic ring-opening family dioxygenase [Pseudohongiellaceae bacterium]|jgi:4,5-DOPA dioxygenase extradiol